MTRLDLIKELTMYELKWLIDQENEYNLEEVSNFFTNGGFSNWTDDQLRKSYDLKIAEEQ